jgi:CTP:molybdopterin cytidylyltransferase MocA
VTTALVVLAAGAGSRFAGPTPKLLAQVAGRPLHAIAVAAAVDAGVGPVIVVTGATPLDLPPGVQEVVNADWSAGIATSLQAGIRAAAGAGHEAVVVGLADQPGVTAEAWRRVAAADATPIAAASYRGRRGNPVRLAAEVWAALPTTGDAGARLLIEGQAHLVAEVPCPGSPDDVDTVEDLHRWT